jgi:AcrR family transcriptional regulator
VTKGFMTGSNGRGRRNTKSEEAILKSTFELLKEKPLRDITIEAIARKAGVGKMTIYKWWPGKAYVALDAYRGVIERNIPIADTGDVERDLADLLRSAMILSGSPDGRIFGQFLAETQCDPDFAKFFREDFLKPRRDAIQELLGRAVKRGEIESTVHKELVLDLLFGPVIFRMMAGYGPPRVEAGTIISTVMCGIGGQTHRPLARRRSGKVEQPKISSKERS